MDAIQSALYAAYQATAHCQQGREALAGLLEAAGMEAGAALQACGLWSYDPRRWAEAARALADTVRQTAHYRRQNGRNDVPDVSRELADVADLVAEWA